MANGQERVQGGLSGAQLGASLGSFTPFGAVVGGAVGAGLGAAFPSVLGFGGRRQAPQIDINALLGQINARIEQAGEIAKQRAIRRAGQQRRGVASNLAARGVLRSPVSENVFGLQRQQTEDTLAGIDEQVLTAQARAAQSIIPGFTQAQMSQQRADAESENRRRAAFFGHLGAISSAVLQNRLQAARGRVNQPSVNVPNSQIQAAQRGTLQADPLNVFAALSPDMRFAQ